MVKATYANQKNVTQLQYITSQFKFICQEVLTCMDKVTFPHHTLNHSDHSTPLRKLAVFRDIEGTQDLCSAVGDMLRIVLLEEGSCSIEEFRRYRSEITFFTDLQ